MIEEMENSSRTALCCPQCREDNLPQCNYCAKCGAALWERCLGCGEPCAAGENYCGACGVRLCDAAAGKIEQLEDDFRAADEMASSLRFDEAITLLTRTSKNDHPRLTKFVSRARERIDQLVAQQQQQRKAAEEACQRARQCLAAFDYDGAAGFIESVPVFLQDKEVQELRKTIEDRQREIGTLVDELREAVRHRRLLELTPRIKRLLALKPDHASVKCLDGQVQEQLVATAKKMLAEHHYDQARQFLEQVSSPPDATGFEQLRRQATELAWLASDLRNAPVVDGTLAAVAERMRRLVPDDERSIRLCDELHRRTRLDRAEQRMEPLPWARPPAETPLGIPVHWLAGFRRVICAERLDRSALQRHPGRFAIACGLALAGIKQASLRINLMPARQPGVLRRISNLMRSEAKRTAWGMDLGASGLKAIKLAWNEVTQQAAIEAAIFVEHSKPLHDAIDEGEQTSVAMETLKKFLDVHDVKAERLCVGLPGRMALIRQIELPPVDAAKAVKLVRFEAAHQFPMPLELLAWDFRLRDHAVSSDHGTEPPNVQGRRALLVAAKRATAEHTLNAFQKLGMNVDLLQPDVVALHNSLVHDRFACPGDSLPSSDCPAIGALDVGCDVTNVVVSSPNSLWFRSCRVAGRSFTNALAKEFDLRVDQAEQRKRAPESVERLSDLGEAWSPVFADLLKEVQQSLSAYTQSRPDHPVEQLLGLGGGFALHGLFRYLRCGR
ncbi:MAG: pilus assembly protein PilM [Pirellulales bacterium]|nr:pilus assembly protein PilM [Pirellulales bacterium]